MEIYQGVPAGESSLGKRLSTRMRFVAVALAAFAATAITAHAATVIITVTGTMASGKDTTGVFGYAPGTDLAGQPFKATFLFDDQKGAGTGFPGNSGSETQNQDPNTSPSIATLMIGTGTYAFGAPPTGAYATSFASRSIDLVYNRIQSTSQVHYGVTDYASAYPATTVKDMITIGIVPATGAPSLTQIYNWYGKFSATQIMSDSTATAFSIASDTQSAFGAFNPTSIDETGLLSGAPAKFAPLVNSPAGPQNGVSQLAAVADFDGDGKMDVATSNFANASVSVLHGNSDGTFKAAGTYSVGYQPWGIVAGDFNRDGKPDLAVVSLDGLLNILLNNGSGDFPTKPSVTIAVGRYPFGLATADMNHDGILDLVVNNLGDQNVGLLYGTGDGYFQGQLTFPVGPASYYSVISPVSPPYGPNVYTANAGNDTLGQLTSTIQGVYFQPEVNYPGGSAPYSIAQGNFGPGTFPSFAVTNVNSGSVSILITSAIKGGFLPPVTYPVGKQPTSVIARDLNGDGWTDLAVANLADGTVSILYGNNDGTFQPQIVIPAGFQPYALNATDVNGDGKVDLVISHWGDSVSVLLQQ